MADPTPIAKSIPKISPSPQQTETEVRQAYATVAADTNWRNSGVPDRHKAKSLIRHSAQGPWGDAYRRLKPEMDFGALIALVGGRGVGKTQLAVCLSADAAMDGQTVKYIKLLDLFRELKGCFRDGGPDEVRTIARWCRFDVLVIDETQEAGSSEWESKTLTNLIDRRYDAGRTTILVSNLKLDAFAAAMGNSIVSRMNEIGIAIECNWPSFRQQMKG